MSSYPPPNPTWPILNSNTFNNDFFTNTNGNLSLDNAYKYFLRLSGGTITGNLNVLMDFNAMGNTYLNNITLNGTLITASATEINYLDITSIGTAEANKALVLDSSRNITNINSLTATGNVYGFRFWMSNSQFGLSHSFSSAGSAEIVTYNDGSNGSFIGTYTSNNFGIATAAINRISIDTSGNVNINNHNSSTTGLRLNNVLITASASEINYLDLTTIGVGEANKALVLDSNRDITNINSLTVNSKLISLNQGIGFEHTDNTIKLISYVNIADLTLNQGAYFGTYSNHNLIFQTNNSEKMRISNTGNVSIGNFNNTYKLDISGDCNVSGNFRINGTSLPSINDLTKISGITNGVVSANKAVVVNVNSNITGFNKITTNSMDINNDLTLLYGNLWINDGNINLYGSLFINGFELVASIFELNKLNGATVSTSELNILDGADLSTNELNILDGATLSTNELNILDGATLSTNELNILDGATLSTTELNYLDTTAGTAQASKALVLNASRNINNINQLSTTGLLSTVIANDTITNVNYQTWTNDLVIDIVTALQMNNVGLDFGTTSNHPLSLTTNNVKRLTINTSGDVNITSSTASTSTSTGSLTVNGGLGVLGNVYGFRFWIPNSQFGLSHSFSSAGSAEIVTYNDGSNASYIGTYNNFNFGIATSGINRISIDTSGNVDINNHNSSTTGLKLNNVLITASASEINYLDLTTIGVGEANKALVLDSNRDITNIHSLTASNNINVTRSSNGECFIASNGTVRSAIHCLTNTSHIGTTTNHNFNIQANDSNVLQCLASGNVNIVNGLQLNGTAITATAAEINYNDITTIGVGEASKTLVLDSNRDITNIRRMTLNGTDDILTLSNNIAAGRITIKFNGDSTNQWELGTRNSNLSPINSFYLYDNNSSAYRLIVDSSGNFNIVNHNSSTTGLKLNDILVTASAAKLNYNDITTIGTGQASKTLVLDASRNITNINSLTSTSSINVTRSSNGECFIASNGTVRSAIHCLTNTSHIGTTTNHNFNIQANDSNVLQCLASGNVNIVNGLQLNGTAITATAAEINYLDITTIGTAEASKALVLDSSRNINNINRLFINSFPSSSISVASLGVNKTGNGFEEIFYCSNGKTRGYLNIKSSNAMVFGTVTPSGETPSHLELMTDNSVKFRMNGSTGNISIGNVEFNPSYPLSVNGVARASQLLVGTSTDTASERLISALDSNQATNSVKYITLGKEAALGNQCEIGFAYQGSNDDMNAMTIGFYGGEIARFCKSGNLGIGTGNQNTFPSGSYKTKLALAAPAATQWVAAWRNNSASTNRCIAFYDLFETEKGGITWGYNGTTAFNTTSDYRLKKDVIPLTGGLDLINKLNPVKFKWKSGDADAEGFIAHELQEILPHCVDGQKDGYYENGTIKYQSVDYGKITTTLVSAVKELTTRLKYLEDFISQLDIEEV